MTKDDAHPCWLLDLQFDADNVDSEFFVDSIIEWVEARGLQIGGAAPFDFALERADGTPIARRVAEDLAEAIARLAQSRGLMVHSDIRPSLAKSGVPLFELRDEPGHRVNKLRLIAIPFGLWLLLFLYFLLIRGPQATIPEVFLMTTLIVAGISVLFVVARWVLIRMGV